MSACPAFSYLLVLPRLQVRNANAISSPLTHGFPSMTAFLGLMWALERKARAAGLDLAFNAIGVVSHDHQEQVAQGGFVKTFHLTRNPVGKDGSTTAIVEEGRIHLETSLVFAVHSERWSHEPDAASSDLQTISELLAAMRVAGGSIVPPPEPHHRRYQPFIEAMTGNEDDQHALFRKLRLRLLPGFTLVARDDLLDTRLAELQEKDAAASRLDAWLSLSRVNRTYQPADEDSKKGTWRHDRTGGGWIVPIPVGYGALGALHDAGSVPNARDSSTPFRFVESLYSIGQWIGPHRLHSPSQMFWYADSRPDESRYRCHNDYQSTLDDDFEIDLS